MKSLLAELNMRYFNSANGCKYFIMMYYFTIILFLMMVMQAVVLPLILGAVSFISYHLARSAAFAVF